MFRLITAVACLLLLPYAMYPQKRFTDVTDSAGIKHAFKVYEGMFGGGACVIDYNNDGHEDVYITGGMNDDALYKNNGDGTFTNVFASAGLAITKEYVTQGVAGADVNKDGFTDLFITTITSRNKKQQIPREINLLLLNNGNGTFKDVTQAFGLDKMYSFSTGGSFGDFNGDGYPDIYVGNYFNQYEGKLSVINDATVVGANQIAKGYLLLNKEGKKYEDVYEDYGLDYRGFGFGGVFTDYDNDGDQDLIVNHDFGYKRTPDMLLQNEFPKERFVDVAKEKKMDLRINSMGTAVGDYNNDGLMDYYFTNIKFNMFMVNQGPQKPFVDKANALGMGLYAISWGANFADFDNDGDLDLYVANGDLNPDCHPMVDFYYENNNGSFTEKATTYGLGDYGIGRGSVVFDYDNDGDLDILVVQEEPVYPNYPVPSVTKLYRNDSSKGNWIKIALKGVNAESHGIGSKVEIYLGNKKMIREIDGGGSSHISQNSVIAHFGLGDATKIDKIVVYWTGGTKQQLLNVDVNQLITIKEDATIKKKSNDNSSLLYFIAFAIGSLIATVFLFRKRKTSQKK